MLTRHKLNPPHSPTTNFHSQPDTSTLGPSSSRVKTRHEVTETGANIESLLRAPDAVHSTPDAVHSTPPRIRGHRTPLAVVTRGQLQSKKSNGKFQKSTIWKF